MEEIEKCIFDFGGSTVYDILKRNENSFENVDSYSSDDLSSIIDSWSNE